MKKIVMISLAFIFTGGLFAQDSLVIKKEWAPHYSNLQFAGNMGLLSLGFGYSFNKAKMGLGFQVGYLPESVGGTRLWTTILKYFWSPWVIQKDDFQLKPLLFGVNIINTRAKGIEREWPDYYPKGYYPWIPSMNYALYFGLGLNYQFAKPQKLLKSLEFYYEIGWVSRLVELWYENPRTVKFHELWNLSLGVRLYVR